jgi:hypothetical protein
MSKSNVKTMLICFFHIKGIIHYENVAPKQTIIVSSGFEMYIAAESLKKTKSLANQEDFVL